jgi:hypothetical protein
MFFAWMMFDSFWFVYFCYYRKAASSQLNCLKRPLVYLRKMPALCRIVMLLKGNRRILWWLQRGYGQQRKSGQHPGEKSGSFESVNIFRKFLKLTSWCQRWHYKKMTLWCLQWPCGVASDPIVSAMTLCTTKDSVVSPVTLLCQQWLCALPKTLWCCQWPYCVSNDSVHYQRLCGVTSHSEVSQMRDWGVANYIMESTMYPQCQDIQVEQDFLTSLCQHTLK